MALRIVVLPDGTWDDCGTVIEVSDESYERLIAGQITALEIQEESATQVVRYVGRDEED